MGDCVFRIVESNNCLAIEIGRGTEKGMRGFNADRGSGVGVGRCGGGGFDTGVDDEGSTGGGGGGVGCHVGGTGVDDDRWVSGE